MGIVAIANFDASELIKEIQDVLIPEWTLTFLINADTEATRMFEEWMGSWDRKYAIETKQLSYDKIEVFIHNEASFASGTSPFDERPARDSVPSYLNFGTSKRFAVLTAGFSAKTAVGLIASGGGSGGFDYVTSEAEPGIEARKIDETVSDELYKMILEIWEKE